MFDLMQPRKNIWEMVDNMFENSLSNMSAGINKIRADIRETQGGYLIEAELPGIKKEDVKIKMQDNVLQISVQQNQEHEEKTENYIRKERRVGSFSRSFYIENINTDLISAKMDNGLLIIEIPKEAKMEQQQKSIDIQ